MESRILEFYCINVADKLALVEKDQIGEVLKSFNSLYKTFSFTLGKFQKENVLLLVIKMLNNSEANSYMRDTNSSLHIHYNSYEPWYTKTACIRELYGRAH